VPGGVLATPMPGRPFARTTGRLKPSETRVQGRGIVGFRKNNRDINVPCGEGSRQGQDPARSGARRHAGRGVVCYDAACA
jgi:hypothetical protein